MSSEKNTAIEERITEGGKIVFATDVIATIASLAAADVKGVVGMGSGMVDGISQMLGRKNLTKGVKVEVGMEEAAVDASIIVEYGFKIHEVCQNVQLAIKDAIETMTGLRVVEVNVSVQGVSFEKPEKAPKEKPEKAKAKEEKEPKAIEPPRVR